MPTRRLLLQSLSAFAVYALLRETRVRAAPRRSANVAAWLQRQDEMAAALAAGALKPLQWQSGVEELARTIEIDALLDAAHRADLRPGTRGSDNDPLRRSVVFKDEQGRRRHLHYGVALFAFERGNVITPHGHRHMVSAHMVVAGTLRLRNFDRLRDEGDAMVLRATRDTTVRAGDISTMSSERDNVHWFVPTSESAMTFDLIVDHLDAGQPAFRIDPVDPLRARPLGDGTVLAPIIGFDESSRRYTSAV